MMIPIDDSSVRFDELNYAESEIVFIRKVMEFRKTANLVFELRTEILIESTEDHRNVWKAR